MFKSPRRIDVAIPWCPRQNSDSQNPGQTARTETPLDVGLTTDARLCVMTITNNLDTWYCLLDLKVVASLNVWRRFGASLRSEDKLKNLVPPGRDKFQF